MKKNQNNSVGPAPRPCQSWFPVYDRANVDYRPTMSARPRHLVYKKKIILYLK